MLQSLKFFSYISMVLNLNCCYSISANRCKQKDCFNEKTCIKACLEIEKSQVVCCSHPKNSYFLLNSINVPLHMRGNEYSSLRRLGLVPMYNQFSYSVTHYTACTVPCYVVTKYGLMVLHTAWKSKDPSNLGFFQLRYNAWHPALILVARYLCLN